MEGRSHFCQEFFSSRSQILISEVLKHLRATYILLFFFCHDAVLSLCFAELVPVEIPIFNIYPTPSPIINNFVTIWTDTRDRHVHPRPHLGRAY